MPYQQKQAALALSSAHLLKSILQKNVGGRPKDLQEIQAHNLELNKIMDKVRSGSSKDFVIMDKILYKKSQTPDIYLLCIPQKVASAATFNLHNLYGFHFSKDQMHNKLTLSDPGFWHKHGDPGGVYHTPPLKMSEGLVVAL